jgi:hypothetical protein
VPTPFLRSTVALLVLILTAPPLRAAEASAPASRAKAFVASFYAWYQGGKKPQDVAAVLRAKKDALAPELYRALQQDLAAARKVKDEVVGLDFDPFLNTQEETPALAVGDAVADGGTYRVPAAEPGGKARVTVEVDCAPAACRIANLHYPEATSPDDENLVALLKLLARDRAARQK